MFLKIYFNDKPLFLCDALTREINAYAHHDDAVFIDEFSTPAVNSMLHEMRQTKVHAGAFYHSNLDELFKAFRKKFSIVQAAGGLVLNKKNEILFIFRRGKWDLPKGKLDKGETLEQCALREVTEETGIHQLKLDKFLLTTFHTYDENGKHILKESHWYTMQSAGKEAPVPQTEEQITEIKWISADGIGACLKNTYPSILDVLLAAGYNPD